MKVLLLAMLMLIGCSCSYCQHTDHKGGAPDTRSSQMKRVESRSLNHATPRTLRDSGKELWSEPSAQRYNVPLTGAEMLLSVAYEALIDSLVSNQVSVAVVANQASIVSKASVVGKDREYVHLVDSMLHRGVKVSKIFSPEHGFRGNAEAGAHVASGVDAQTGLPVVSLYGNNKKPTVDQLKGIRLVIFDLQDVGCRFYTYISTLHYVMQACAENNIPLIVLDRPNPNDGYVDGPVMEPSCTSFVGMHPVPIVYGMTIGEYALMINGEGWLKTSRPCSLRVVKMNKSYYRHGLQLPLPIAPSPNLQNAHSVALYPSLCWFEGTNISVGRGTDSPFEQIGSPKCSLRTFSFDPHPIPGVSNNPPFNGKKCYGIDLRDSAASQQIKLGWLLSMYKTCPHDDFFLSNGFFDKLAGTPALRKQIQQGLSEEEIRRSWQPKLSQFKAIRAKYLLYDEYSK